MSAWRALGILVVLLAPMAGAGSADAPDLEDGPDQVAVELDLRAAWVEREEDGLRFHVQTQAMRTAARNHMWVVVLSTESGAWLAGVAVDAEGTLRTTLQPPGFRGGPGTFRDELREPRVATGEPGVASALIPWGAVPGLRPGERVNLTAAGTDLYGRGGWTDIDYAYGDVPLDTSLPGGGGFVPLALLGAGALLLAGAGAWAALRTRRKRPAARQVSNVAAQSPEDAAERFRLDPRR